MKQKAIQTQQAPIPKGPYSQAIRAQNLLFVAGQIPVDLTTSKIVGQTTAEQTKVVLGHIKAILEAAGLSFVNVVKVEVFITQMADAKEMNEMYAQFFNFDPKPARYTVEVSSLPMGAMVEIACIASFEGEAKQ